MIVIDIMLMNNVTYYTVSGNCFCGVTYCMQSLAYRKSVHKLSFLFTAEANIVNELKVIVYFRR